MKHMKSLALALLAAFTLTACNTFEGMGRDVERGGEKVQDASKRSR